MTGHLTSGAAVSLIVALVKEHPDVRLLAVLRCIIVEAGHDVEAFAREMIDEEQDSAAFLEFLNSGGADRPAKSAA